MEPIAIIGMACRMPGASSLEKFWDLLCHGGHGIGLVPEDRWDRERIFHPDPEKAGKINTRHGAFLERSDLFDHQFFLISAEEATQMDPQQRILLELTYEAFEDANLRLPELEGTDAGVFIGVMSNDYMRYQSADEYRHINRHTGCGSGYCMIANRISYQFNLRGPSMAIDSACSSSLFSVFTACQNLWMRQCSLAVAGGVNLILSPVLSMFYTRGGLSSPDGKCRTFSGDANGIGRGEGAGVVIMKRMSDAVRDGDRIYAVIRGGALNHNGRGNGMSAPNRWAQQLLLRRACEHAGIRPGDLQYVELHGTGTLIGDAIEATALGSVLAEDRGKAADHACWVGSVKTNVGHLEGAAGIAGLIKLALCLSHGRLVPSLWYNTPNPHISFATLPLKVQQTCQDWPETDGSRLAGISSFGLGGANAHLVLQSAPAPTRLPAADAHLNTSVLLLSARSESALVEMADRYGRWIETLNNEEFSRLYRTTLIRAQNHNHRAAFVASDREEMILSLRSMVSGTPSSNVFFGMHQEVPRPKSIFIFPDFGTMDLSAMKSLIAIHGCFQESLTECDRAIREVLRDPASLPFARLCDQTSHPDRRLLPLLYFGTQVALAALWQKAGFRPNAVAGIGMGKVAAWLISGAIDMRSAVARIAAAYCLELTQFGLACLSMAGTFRMDCYSSSGKNVPLEEPQCLEKEYADGDPRKIFPGLPQGNGVHYFLLSLEPRYSSLLESCNSAPFTAVPPMDESFWRDLARLSIAYNIEWKNLVQRPAPMRTPRYPWQRSRFWLQTDSAPAAEAALPTGPVQAVVRDNKKFLPPLETATAARRPTASGIDRETLLALPESERRAVLAAYLKRQIGQALRLSAEEVEEPQTFTGLGIDSVSALELKHRIETDLKVPVSMVKLLDGHSIGELASEIATEGLLHAGADAPDPEAVSPVARRVADQELPANISQMPAEDVDRMLLELLAGEAAPHGNTLNKAA
jgi:acyl transferase domain-containing protein